MANQMNSLENLNLRIRENELALGSKVEKKSQVKSYIKDSISWCPFVNGGRSTCKKNKKIKQINYVEEGKDEMSLSSKSRK